LERGISPDHPVKILEIDGTTGERLIRGPQAWAAGSAFTMAMSR
jgi:hypothetical protein